MPPGPGGSSGSYSAPRARGAGRGLQREAEGPWRGGRGASSVVLPSVANGARLLPPVGVDLVGRRAPVAVPLSESLEAPGFGHVDSLLFLAAFSWLTFQQNLVGAGRGAWETGSVFPNGCGGCLGLSAFPKAGLVGWLSARAG